MESIQLFKPKFRTDEISTLISDCCEIGWTGLGYKTEEFERAFKAKMDLPNSHFVSSATAGLQLAIKVLKDANKWKNRDEIITTPLTFVSSNHSILYNNLKPVFADVDDQLCLDVSSVESLITKRTRAVMFVGLGGNVGQYNKIKTLCDQYELKLILDAAHMAGTKIIKSYNGTAFAHSQIGWDADATVFSFQAVKNLPTADSGMVCFKNTDYDQLARKLSWLGIDKDTFKRTNSTGSYKWDYDVIDLGYKFHGNSIMASMGLVGLKYLNEDNERRREICNMYDELFEENSKINPVKHSENCISSRHLYQVRVKNRDQVMEYLNANGIFPGVHYKDNTEYDLYSFGRGTCLNAHKLSNEIISLPLHLFLTDGDVERISDVIKKAVKK